MAGAGRVIARAKGYIVMANTVIAHILMARIVMVGPWGWVGDQSEVGRQAVRQGGRLATFRAYHPANIYEHPP